MIAERALRLTYSVSRGSDSYCERRQSFQPWCGASLPYGNRNYLLHCPD
jgi:hypothetical protein